MVELKITDGLERINPMRSLMFVPGDSERKLSKSLESKADVLILDLEDAVSSERTSIARKMVLEFLQSQKKEVRRHQIWIRCNPLSNSESLHDISEVVAGKPDGFLLPKVRNGHDVSLLCKYLTILEVHTNQHHGSIKIIPTLTETSQSLLTGHTFINNSERVEGFSWGPIDLMAEIGATTNRNKDGSYAPLYELARSLTLLVSNSNGVEAIDTICGDFRNTKLLEGECALAASMGFTGKLAIHPDQIDVINAAFTPSSEDVEKAIKVVEAFSNSDVGVVNLDGVMLDMPHLKHAKSILQRAKHHKIMSQE